MVSKKKRPPPGIETSEPSIQKKIKVDGAGTSNDGGVASLKTNSSRKHSKSKQDLVETDLKIEDVDIEEEDTHTNQILPVVRNEDFPDWPEADLLELMKRMESEIPAKDNLRFDSRAEKLDWSKICFGDYSAKQCKDMWIQIQKRLRRYRLLKEVLEDAKLWVSKPWTHFYRSSKQNRHPRMPRRPLSTYMLFYVEKKDKVAKENPGLEMTAVSKIIANMYKNLPAKKKQKYTDMAAKQRREYEEKLEQFYQEYPELVPKREAKVVSHDLGPRKPTPPFKLYFEDKLNQHKDDPDFDRQALLEKCKEQWRNMADKKKVVWINWALEEEAKYLEALKSQKLDDPEALSKVKTVLTKEERHLRERVAGKPEKPPNSGYSLFSRLMLVSADMKQVAPKERMAHISQLWKVLPEAQKMKYQEQVAHMLDQYKLEYASYLESLPEDKRREELLNNTPKRRAPVKYTVPKPVEEEDSSKKSVPPKKKTKEKEEEKTKSKKSENKTLFKGEPEPPPVNAYQLFLKSFIANSTHLSPEFREKEAPRYWQMLPDSDKAKYRKVLNEIKAKYIEDYEKFLKTCLVLKATALTARVISINNKIISLSQEQLKEYSLQKASLKKEESGADSSSDSDDSDDDSDSSDNQQGSGSGSSSDSDSDSSDSSDSNDSDGEEKDNGSDSSSSNSSDSD